VVYATNWLNIGAIFPVMETTIRVGVLGLGEVTSAFYIGLGLAQIPAGILAARFGPKRIVITGIMLSSFATIGIAGCTDVAQVAELRFVVGSGMAMVFAPAVVLVAKFLGENRAGVGVGVFNSSFDIGGLIGLYAWVVIATAEGWQNSLILSGGLGVITGVLVVLFVPSDSGIRRSGMMLTRLVRILGNGQLILLGLGTLGISAGNLLLSSFMVYYLNSTQGVSLSNAGLVAACVVVVPIATAIWGGRLYDRTSRPKAIMVVSGLGIAGSLAITSTPGIVTAAVGAIVGGAASGIGFTVAFAWARDLNPVGHEYAGLAIAWVNGLSLTGAFFPPLIFSEVAGSLGYSSAWLVGGLICVAFTIPVLFQREGVPSREESLLSRPLS
jgi:MFS family permease